MLKKHHPSSLLWSLITIIIIVIGTALIAGYLVLDNKCVYKGPWARVNSGACSGNTDNTMLPVTDNIIKLDNGIYQYIGSDKFSFTFPESFKADDNGDAILVYEKDQSTKFFDRMVIKRIPYTESASMDITICTDLIASYAEQNKVLGTITDLKPGEITMVDNNLTCAGGFVLNSPQHPNPVTENYYTVYSQSQQADYLLLILVENKPENLTKFKEIINNFKIY